jgi:hypothetical protein
MPAEALRIAGVSFEGRQELVAALQPGATPFLPAALSSSMPLFHAYSCKLPRGSSVMSLPRPQAWACLHVPPRLTTED